MYVMCGNKKCVSYGKVRRGSKEDRLNGWKCKCGSILKNMIVRKIGVCRTINCENEGRFGSYENDWKCRMCGKRVKVYYLVE